MPHTCNQQRFIVNCLLELIITFSDTEIRTQVYIKLDTQSSAVVVRIVVFHQLGIVSYHPQVEIWRRGRKGSQQKVEARVPMVRGSLSIGSISQCLVDVQTSQGQKMMNTVICRASSVFGTN